MAKVLGIGNALVDIMTILKSDDLLNSLGLPKGSMQLVSNDVIIEAMKLTKNLQQTLASGGSAANTINGMANLGLETAFIGKVGNDEMGTFFRNDMISRGVAPNLMIGSGPTGKALALVSPDSERTFAVNLGAAIELTPDDIPLSLFEGYKYFHIEGYLVQNHQLIEQSLKFAKKAGLTVSLDLASYNVVEANLTFLKEMVKDYVDIVFANEEEAKAFTGKQPEAALDEIAKMAKIAVVKIGERGSLIKSGEITTKVGVIKASPIDTTGAGDLYAAGFIFGLSKGLSLYQCGEIGAILSGRVIEVIGPKMDTKTWDEVAAMVNKVLRGEKIAS